MDKWPTWIAFQQYKEERNSRIYNCEIKKEEHYSSFFQIRYFSNHLNYLSWNVWKWVRLLDTGSGHVESDRVWISSTCGQNSRLSLSNKCSLAHGGVNCCCECPSGVPLLGFLFPPGVNLLIFQKSKWC